ncbi:hypothetical protein BJY01DRAFT_256467 [Aspergillus pseudoustus]|uniref:Uncharacterized protein n=1 Tax=Aspergillus pseudoustus TaxID=1810923 RepID=A0ABR4IC40_9EURO
MISSPSKVSDDTRFGLLMDEVRKALDLACRDRREGGLQFSAAHLPGILSKAARHAARTRQWPFDIIGAARPPSRAEEWTSHLGHFLEQGKHLSHEVQDSIIASCLLIEAYPPRTHGGSLDWRVFHFRWLTIAQSFIPTTCFAIDIGRCVRGRCVRGPTLAPTLAPHLGVAGPLKRASANCMRRRWFDQNVPVHATLATSWTSDGR